MSLPPWRSHLENALDRNCSLVYTRYLQLATIRLDGRPANRTVVFRGFLDDTNLLKFVTDSRSEKAEQIEKQPWGEACWYFPITREQFRFLGKLTLVRENYSDSQMQKARQMSWQELSDAARVQFSWPHPGKLRGDTEVFQPLAPNSRSPLSNFGLLLLEPEQVDILELRGEPHNRSIYRLDGDGNWLVEAINP